MRKCRCHPVSCRRWVIKTVNTVQDLEKRPRKMSTDNQVGELLREMKPDNRWSTIDGITITLVDEPYKAEIFYYEEQELHYLKVYVLADGVFVLDEAFGRLALDWTGHPSRKQAIQTFHFYVIEQRAKSCS